MCTALSLTLDSHYFGRNLDLHMSYGEAVAVTPRNYPLRCAHGDTLFHHRAIIGMALVSDGYPLYFDAVNECGLAAAALNFPGVCTYGEEVRGRLCLASYEVIPQILARCDTVSEARTMLEECNVTSRAFKEDLPPTPLHYIVSDCKECVVAEPTEGGLRVYDDPPRVLTNAPGLPHHLHRLEAFRGGDDRLAAGLPGELSSEGRFVRAAVLRDRCERRGAGGDGVATAIDLLRAVAIPRGCVFTEDGEVHRTVYTSCCDTERGVYYYLREGEHAVYAADLREAELEGDLVVLIG